MHKLPALSPRKVIRILKKKGFVLERSKGSHRIYYHPEENRTVVIPYHKKDLPKGTLLEILRQAGIEKSDLEDLL